MRNDDLPPFGALHLRVPPGLVAAFLASAAVLAGPGAARAQVDVERFDGSFRLVTGEVVTGGYMVEGDGFWIYMDVEGLDRGGAFRPGATPGTFVSFAPPDGAVTLEFRAPRDGFYDSLVWREGGRTLRGARVHPHTSRIVSFTSADGTRLAGRLLLPRCEGPHPAVVTVHGSGPANRYGGTFHTFFLKHGIAVLAYDKRGYTDDPDPWREPDLAAMSEDAAAAVRFAAGPPEVDPVRVGLWGSSQGGWVVPAAALAAPETAYMILRAGAAATHLETILHEIRQEVRADGVEGMDLDHAMDLRREVYELAMRGAPAAAADSLVAPYMDEPWYQTAFGDGPISELWSAHWWGWAGRNFRVASAPDVARYPGPVLWFLGERDEAVPLIATRAALERAFAASPGEDQRVVIVENAPHSFLIPSDDGPPRYAEGVFSGMAEWLEARGFTGPGC